MKRLLPLLVVVILSACNAPKPAVPSFTPAISPSYVPAVSPSLVPSVAPAPIPSTTVPTAKSTPNPAQPTLDPSLLPALERTIALSPVRFHDFFATWALDEPAERLYVSLSPSRTVILDTKTLAPVGEIPAGGVLTVNPAAQRLYIGVSGSSSDKADGTKVIAPAELKLFDTANLTLVRSAVFSATATSAPLVAIDAPNNKIYVTQAGVYVADATTLAVSSTLSGTFPSSPEPLWATYARNAIVDPLRQRLWVNIWGDPKLNPPYIVLYDLSSGQVIARLEGYNLAAVDPTTGEAYADANHAKLQYDAQGQNLKRLANVTGSMYLDAVHDRVYVFDCDVSQTIKVLDRDLNFLGYGSCGGLTEIYSGMVDPVHDRLLLFLASGQLEVLQGHAQPIGQPTPAALAPRQAVQWIVPDLNDHTEQSLFAAFGPDRFNVGHGTLYRSRDMGGTWELVSGLPLDEVSNLKFAAEAIFAAAGGDGITSGYGIWRSVDDGQTWLPSAHGLTDLGITHLAVSPDFERDGTLFALSPRDVFRSTDRGTTWAPLADRYAPLLKDLTVTFHAVALSPNFAQDNTLLIGHTSGLWRSTDRGETWTNIAGGPAANRLAYTPDGSIVLAINYEGVHRSDDGGLTWRLVNDGLDPTNSTISDVQINDREAVILVTRFDQPGAIYRLPLNETRWQRLPIEADVSALALMPDDALLIGTAGGAVPRVQ